MASTRTSLVAGLGLGLGLGLAAGAAGTAFMTAYQEGVARARGSAGSPREPRTWAEAPAPAQFVKKISRVPSAIGS